MPTTRKIHAIRAGACAVAIGAVAVALVASSSAGDSDDGAPAPAATTTAAATAAEPAAPATTAAPVTTAAAEPTSEPAAPPVALRPPGDGPPVLAPTADGVRIVRPADGTATLDGAFALAGGAGTDAIVNVGSDGEGATVSRILIQDPASGENVLVRTVPGAWSLPAAVPSAGFEGLSWDGSTIVLHDTDDTGRFLAVRTADPQAKPLVLRPAGTFTFDSVSTDGGLLFLSQSADAQGAPVDQIRAVDLRSGKLLPDPVVDKAGGQTTMTGLAVARATTSLWAYTVYVGGEEPFIHALGTGQGPFSLCLDLPEEADDAAARGSWSIAASRDGTTAVAVNGTLGMAYAVTDQGAVVPIELAGTSGEAPPVAVESSSTAYVATSAGIERLDLAAHTAATIGATPPFLTALLATADGVLAVGGGWEPLGLLG